MSDLFLRATRTVRWLRCGGREWLTIGWRDSVRPGDLQWFAVRETGR